MPLATTFFGCGKSPPHRWLLGVLSTLNITPETFLTDLEEGALAGFSRELFLEEVRLWASCGFHFGDCPAIAPSALIDLVRDAGVRISDLQFKVASSQPYLVATSTDFNQVLGQLSFTLPPIKEADRVSNQAEFSLEHARAMVAGLIICPQSRIRIDTSIMVSEVAYWLRRSACESHDGILVFGQWLAISGGRLAEVDAHSNPSRFLLLKGLVESGLDIWDIDKALRQHRHDSLVEDMLIGLGEEWLNSALRMPSADANLATSEGRPLLNVVFWRALLASSGDGSPGPEEGLSLFRALLAAGVRPDGPGGQFPIRRVVREILDQPAGQPFLIAIDSQAGWNPPAWADGRVVGIQFARACAGQLLAAMEAADLAKVTAVSPSSTPAGHIHV